ncbi:MAG TPA: hypothetical protein VL860_11670 [Planctomycetota bacterium]|nr:hypothetical protein [Planctomycetota bacterium]
MPSTDGSSSGGSQRLKPKASKTDLKSPSGSQVKSERPSKPDASASKKLKSPKESALIKATSGDEETAPKKKNGTAESGITKSPKVSGKTPATDAGSSSTILKVKKKKSSTTGQALNPKKSSLRKTAPADAEPIKATDDLEPVEVGDEAEVAGDEPEETTVAYKEPPADPADDADGVTETYVLNKEDEEAAEKAQKAKKTKAEDADESDDEPEEIADDDQKAADDKSEDEAGDDEKKEEAEKEEGKGKKNASGKASKKMKSSKRDASEMSAEAAAKQAERTSSRASGQKKANRFQAMLFLFFAIGTVVLLIACGIVIWVKWGNRPKEELNIYQVPAFPGETFGTLQAEFTKEANPTEFLIAQNAELPADKPFDKEVRVKVNIPKAWGKLSSDSSFVVHFMGEVDKDLAKNPPDIPSAHRKMPLVHQMLERFIMKVGSNTEETKKKYKKDVEDLEAQIAEKEKGGEEPAPGTTPGATPGPGTTPPPGSEAAIEDENKKLRRLSELCNPINANMFQAHNLIAGGKKDEALAELKKALDQIEKLKALKEPDAKETQVINAIKKADKIKPLFDKGAALTTEDIEAAFPDTKPSTETPADIPEGPTEAK